MKTSVERLGWAAILACAGLLAGCAGLQGEREWDTAEAVLAAPPDKVREAVVEVLMEGGYEIVEADLPGGVVKTEYRRELHSPWNRLLVSRFGVGRSVVESRIAPAEGGTHLTIRVGYEAKDRQWASWESAQPPLAQSAANQLRLVKNALGLL
jgi:hypothetical protein